MKYGKAVLYCGDPYCRVETPELLRHQVSGFVYVDLCRPCFAKRNYPKVIDNRPAFLSTLPQPRTA